MNIVNKNDGDKEVVQFVADFILAGKTIAYPTETVYGLGCDATNFSAVNQIKKIKGNEAKKPLIILVSDLKMAKEYAVFNKQSLQLARSNWPGALTLILPTTELGMDRLKSKTIGLRISSNVLATAIVKKINKPLISTSANLAGAESAQSGQQVMDIFLNRKLQPDLILDAGKLKKSKGSTIVDCTGDEVTVIRRGDIKI